MERLAEEFHPCPSAADANMRFSQNLRERNMDIQTVVDRAEIMDLIQLYCRGVDRVDEATLRSIYHDDATEDRGEGLFIGPAQEWVGWTIGLLPAFSYTQHCVMNMLIEVNGDVAHGETYFVAYHRFDETNGEDLEAALRIQGENPQDLEWPEGGSEFILAGRYLDRFERRNDVWKIAYRKMINDWCRTRPLAQEWFHENPTAYRGVRRIADSRLDSELHPRRLK